jgi:flagellar FliL protein
MVPSLMKDKIIGFIRSIPWVKIGVLASLICIPAALAYVVSVRMLVPMLHRTAAARPGAVIAPDKQLVASAASTSTVALSADPSAAVTVSTTVPPAQQAPAASEPATKQQEQVTAQKPKPAAAKPKEEKSDGLFGFFKKKNKDTKDSPATGNKKKSKSAPMIGPTIALNPIVVNVAGSNARRYLKATIVLELGDEKLTEEINKRSPQIYDALIGILSMYRVEDITNISGREALREEMKDRINLFLSTGKVINVYFNELVIQ